MNSHHQKAVFDGNQLVCPTCGIVPVNGWIQGPSAGSCENIQCTECGDWYWWDGMNTVAFLRHAMPGEGPI